MEYTGIYYPSEAAQIQDIASWFSVLQGFRKYLGSLPQTEVTGGTANVLGDITVLLNSVLSEYTDVHGKLMAALVELTLNISCPIATSRQVQLHQCVSGGTSCDHASISMFG